MLSEIDPPTPKASGKSIVAVENPQDDEKNKRRTLLNFDRIRGGPLPNSSSDPKDGKSKSERQHSAVSTSSVPPPSLKSTWRDEVDQKVVGLKDNALDKSTYAKRRVIQISSHSRRSAPNTINTPPAQGTNKFSQFSVEEKEILAHEKALTNPFQLLYLGNMAAIKVMLYYMITLETIISCGFTVGLTLYWYFAYLDDSTWNGGSMDFVLLAFTLTAPISSSLGLAFQRRERALIAIADFRSWSYHLYLAHSLWDWTDEKGGRFHAEIDGVLVDWVEHCDAVMAQLIGIGDELSRFLSLPTTSRSRHRMTKQGRKEAARTIEVAYHLLESMSTQRMTRLVMYSERLKKIGLPATEVSRLRQYERFLSNVIEQLRTIKMYRTPQAFRSFARIFTLVLPPFYAPTFAQVAKDVNSLGLGVAFGIITALGLTALFESLQVLEDPFTAFLTLDGIDVHEELEVLHFAQLVNTRSLIFADAPPYPPGRRTALTSKNEKADRLRAKIGLPPMQYHHHHQHKEDVTSHPTVTPPSTIEVAHPFELGSIPSFTEEEADVELGVPMDEVEDTKILRETSYQEESDQLEKARLRKVSSYGTLKNRRHRRDWSRD